MLCEQQLPHELLCDEPGNYEHFLEAGRPLLTALECTRSGFHARNLGETKTLRVHQLLKTCHQSS